MSDAQALLDLYEAKSLAELQDAEEIAGCAEAPRGWRGDPLGSVALVVARPSEADVQAGEPLRGEVGDAADKILVALGIDPTSAFVVSSRPCEMSGDLVAPRLRAVLEAVTATLVIALDEDAAEDVARAFAVEDIPVGSPVRSAGRTLGAVGDLAASLARPDEKAMVWKAFKTLAAATAL